MKNNLQSREDLVKEVDKLKTRIIKMKEKETEQKQLETLLHLKNLAFKSSIAANSIFDTNGILIEANPAVIDLWKYDNKNEVIGMSIYDFLQKGEEAEKIINSLKKTNKWEGVFNAKRKDGSKFIAQSIATVIRDKNNNLFGYQSSVVDITEKIKAELKFKTEQDNFSSIFNSMADGIYIINKEYDVSYINPVIKENFGSPKNKKCYEYFHNFNKPCSFCKNKKVFSGETIRVEQIYQKINKTYDLIYTPLKNINNDITYKFAIARDITKQKQVIDALSKANKIVNRSPAVAFLWKNSEGWPVEFVSENVKKVLGYSSEDFLTNKVLYEEIIQPECLKRVKEEAMMYSIDKKIKEFTHKPYRIITKDGQIIWIETQTNVIRDSRGKVTHYQGIIMNITERIENEQNLIKLNEEHIKTNMKLKETQSILIQQEKMASLGGLAAGIAHEINNPLGFVMSNFRTLKNYMETIKDYLELTEGSDKNPALKKKIDFIMEDMEDLFKESKDGFDRIALIVDNMRQFSRVDNENKKTSINLNNLINNTLVIAKNSYKYVAKIITRLSEIPEISCNRSEINQVFLNIIVNAAQAIEQQKNKKKGMITIRTYVKENKVCCEIENNGPGIPEKYLNKVFDPFFTTKDVGKGTGMGLSISYDIIVNKHRGELIVKSDEKSGTIFTIKLPLNLNVESVKDKFR